MKYLSFLSLLAVHFLFVSSEGQSKNTEEVRKTEDDEILIATADVTENRTRLTASLHEEFVIFQCTLDSEEALDTIASTLRDQGNERSACCDWIVQTANRLLLPDNDGATPSWTVALCARHLAAVPSPSTILNATSSRSSQVVEPSQLATYMFLYPRRRKETANGLFPPPTSSSITSKLKNNDDYADPSNSWKHYVWLNEMSGTGEWMVDNERRPPISIVQDSTNDDDSILLPPVTAATDTTVKTSLRSTLSEKGGMHRDFHHVLQLENVPYECRTENNNCTFSVWISLYLAADVFINTEDAFSSNSNNPKIEFQVYTADNGKELIDQEEPAFASPWHVVLVHLQGPVLDENDGNATVMIEWDSLLHLRYPSPVVERDFARIHVLAPQLVDGFLQSSTDTNSARYWKMEPKDEFELQHKHPAVLSTWVAVGREEDYQWILGLTMVAATVGAAVMMRDISRVASWS
jgi:hypothetical protein